MVPLGAGGDEKSGRVRNFDVDLESRNRITAIHFDLNVVVIDRNVPGDDRQNLLAKNRNQVHLAAGGPFIGEENLQPLSRNRGGSPSPEQSEDTHAALRPNSLSKNPFLSLGIVIGTTSPASRRAAAA